mmetsp:Transcript_10722/g.41642  ORF Transcript_10722/g.41642 Transcript_10722/m.41642 type:complete len:233 (+) Transcript_10722:915-1613(+)
MALPLNMLPSVHLTHTAGGPGAGAFAVRPPLEPVPAPSALQCASVSRSSRARQGSSLDKSCFRGRTSLLADPGWLASVPPSPVPGRHLATRICDRPRDPVMGSAASAAPSPSPRPQPHRPASITSSRNRTKPPKLSALPRSRVDGGSSGRDSCRALPGAMAMALPASQGLGPPSSLAAALLLPRAPPKLAAPAAAALSQSPEAPAALAAAWHAVPARDHRSSPPRCMKASTA